MTEEQYYEMIRLSIILNGSYGVQGCKSRSDEWNKMYRKYMKLRNLYRKSRGLNDCIHIQDIRNYF